MSTLMELSFKVDIVNWLSKCVEDLETSKIAPIREILLQLIRTIKKLTKQLDDGVEMEIKNVLKKSSENIRSAVLIEESLKKLKIELLEKIFKTLLVKLEEQNFVKPDNYEHDFIGERTERFYNGRSCPGLSFKLKEDIKPNIDMLLRIEVDNRIYAGIILTKNGVWDKEINKEDLVSKEDLQKILKNKNLETDKRWVYSEYLPDGDGDSSPNFRDFNDEYYKLYDDVYFNEFIKQSVKRIIDIKNLI